MDNHPAIRPNSKHHNKSAYASKAIEWFFQSPVLTRERDSETGDYTGKYVRGSHGSPTPISMILKIEELQQELQDIHNSQDIARYEAKHTPPGWVRRVINWIVGQ